MDTDLKSLPPIRWLSYLAVPVERVYRTLTTAEGWDGWFTRGTSLDARLGGEIRMRWRDADRTHHRVTLWGAAHTVLEIGGEVVAIETNRRFSFRWSPAGHPTTVEFELNARGEGTLVTVTDSGFTDGDLGSTGVAGQMDQPSVFALCASGWGEAVTLLKFYLEHGVQYGEVPPK